MSKLVLWADSLYSSPYAMSAYVCLREKGLPFDLRVLNLAQAEHRSPDYVRQSLTSRVPTLADQDFALSESSAIIEYLEERFTPPTYPRVFPADPKDRARCRQIQAWLRSDFVPIREERSTTVIFKVPSTQPLSPQAGASVAQLYAACEVLLADVDEHLFGQWSIADTELAVMLSRLLLNGDDMPGKLKRYAQVQWRRASVQAWVALPRDWSKLG